MRSLKSLFLLSGVALILNGCAQSASGAPSNPQSQPASAHHDHSSQHGGTVLMDGDIHFEVVPNFEGKHVVHFSGADRKPLPSTKIEKATLTVMPKEGPAEDLVLRPQEDGRWTATGRPIDGDAATVRFAYVRRGAQEPYWIDLPATRQPSSEHHGHAH